MPALWLREMMKQHVVAEVVKRRFPEAKRDNPALPEKKVLELLESRIRAMVGAKKPASA